MPRKGQENLIPTNRRTKEEARIIGAKGGKKSGQARREKADLRKSIQMALDAEYTDKNGEKFTGTAGIARVLVTKALSSKDKDCIAAIKYINELLGVNRTEEQKERDKAEIALLQAKIKAMTIENIDTDNEVPKLYEALGAVEDDILKIIE